MFTPISKPDKHDELLNIHFKLLVKKLKFSGLVAKGYSIKTYHPGGDPTLKLAKPPLEVQLSVYRPTLEPFSFNTYPPLEEIFYIFQDGFSCMYVCMYVTVCTHLFKLTPTMCLLKMSLLKYFYRIFFFWQGGRGGGGGGA